MWTGKLIPPLILCWGLWAQNPDRPDDGVRPLIGEPSKKTASQGGPAPHTADGKPDLSGIWEPPGIRFPNSGEIRFTVGSMRRRSPLACRLLRRFSDEWPDPVVGPIGILGP